MTLIGVKIGKSNKIIKCFDNNLKLTIGDSIILDTELGIELGIVSKIYDINVKENEKDLLVKVLSIASKKDIKNYEKNLLDAKRALDRCRKLVEKYDLKMYVIDAAFTLDRNQLYFRFMADSRVDFRDLAKELATIYKTRIELRQMGVRDRAKELGGFGQCGRNLCCSKFMNDFDSISINMAKTQNIALNPSKINGICGRLLCCLKYENECYKECSKGMPQLNKKIKTSKGEGKVVSVDVLRGNYKVNIPDIGIVEFEKEKNESN